MKLKVISGGQTGVDQAGLFAANTCDIETGGWAPKGWKTLNGAAPWLTDFGLKEHESADYRKRTERNVEEAHLTILVAQNWVSAGTRLTADLCFKHKKPMIRIGVVWVESCLCRCSYPHFELDPLFGSGVDDIACELKGTESLFVTDGTFVVNVAGNSESNAPGIGEFTERLLREVFKKWLKY